MRNQSWGGLQVRLLLLMFLALFPLGLIAVWQTVRVVEEARRIDHQALLDATKAASLKQRALIQQAIGAGHGLAATARSTDVETCRRAMAGFLRDNPGYAFAGYIPVSGLMDCSSDGARIIDFSTFDSFQNAISNNDVFLEVNDVGAVSGDPVVIINVPVREAGTLAGFVSLSIPQQTMVSAGPGPQTESGLTLALVSNSGAVFDILDAEANAAQFLPSTTSIDDLFLRKGSSFLDQDHAAQLRRFAVTEAAGDSYVVVGSWPRPGVNDADSWLQLAMPMLFSVLMWTASMTVAYLGLRSLVLQHLASLRSAMRRFALGERDLNALKLVDAPDEFIEAERAFNRMALLITDAEARQTADLQDKEVLLREVHHRVKNNLQMIASIMNLQSRNAQTVEARRILDSLKRRVRALATLHRSLYTQTETAQVDGSELLQAVLAEASAVSPSREIRIESDLQPVLLYPDQAVPLSMWASEALTNAVKYVGRPPEGQALINVALQVDGEGRAQVIIENSQGKALEAQAEASEDGTGVGSTLMTAFTKQLGGDVKIDDHSDMYRLALSFPVRGFEPDAPL